MTKVLTIGQEIVENDLLDEVSDQAALDKIAALIDGQILQAFRNGFEHATAGGEEAGRRMPQLKGAMPLVVYVADDATRRELKVPGRGHGCRKAGATIAAENGATPHQLMAIFGWKTLEQAELYTKKVRQQLLAAGAMTMIVAGQTIESDPPLLLLANSGSTSG